MVRTIPAVFGYFVTQTATAQILIPLQGSMREFIEYAAFISISLAAFIGSLAVVRPFQTGRSWPAYIAAAIGGPTTVLLWRGSFLRGKFDWIHHNWMRSLWLGPFPLAVCFDWMALSFVTMLAMLYVCRIASYLSTRREA